jgi:hypothetical protein
MITVIIPHFLANPRFLGRPRLLTRVSALSVERDIHPISTTALFRERSPVATLSMAAHNGADPVVRRTYSGRCEDSAAFRHRRGEGSPSPPLQPYFAHSTLEPYRRKNP